jgi:hypothetical protein
VGRRLYSGWELLHKCCLHEGASWYCSAHVFHGKTVEALADHFEGLLRWRGAASRLGAITHWLHSRGDGVCFCVAICASGAAVQWLLGWHLGWSLVVPCIKRRVVSWRNGGSLLSILICVSTLRMTCRHCRLLLLLCCRLLPLQV